MVKICTNQYIIAIGASAGGLEAIADFFDHTPLDAVSYILIQHMSADFKSQMAQILSPHSKLKIIEVTDEIRIEPNLVYLIPSSKYMIVKDGWLILSDKKEKQPPHLTIDCFFTSLAEDCGDKAIGIILSGTGDDGSKGVEAINSFGGMVIVQDPKTAAFQEMPISALETGCADYIVEPKKMPQIIEDYVKNGTADLFDHSINETVVKSIFSLINGSSPLDFTDYKRPTILRRIKRRMVLHNILLATEYLEYLHTHPEEVELLANDFLISVTSFFRDPEAFSIIEKTVIPAIMEQQSKDDIVKIWVAGCATGEEAYSMAILVKEYLTLHQSGKTIKIYATDINKSALAIASKGLYPDTISKVVSEKRLADYFTAEGQHFRVKQEVRRMIVFAAHDLIKNVPFCNIDLISCRNLLIYMNLNLQERAFSMMHFGLKKDGFLFLGPSENTSVLKPDFKETSAKWNILRSHKIGQPVKFNTFSPPVIGNITTSSAMDLRKNTLNKSKNIIIDDEFNLAILEETGFNGVCTDEHLFVIKSFGDTRAYLKNENFKFDLNDLIPEEVSVIFKAAAYKALKLNQRIELKKMVFQGILPADQRMVNVIFKPFQSVKSADKLLLILFVEAKSRAKAENIIGHAGFTALAKDHLNSLEKELAESKHKLETANERSASADENMQSYNEEQQSANEEMHSANEELQSVNEELHTINKEYQATNAKLTELNDDLNNYFRSNVNGQLFVDRDLLLKKYSPGAVKHINILESDIGRPLSNITTNIKFETLINDIKQVILDEKTITREAEASNGKIYQVMTMPYIRKSSKEPDGAVISFYDITELKKVSRELDITNKKLHQNNGEITLVNTQLQDRNEQLNNSKKYIEEIFNTIHDPLVILDKELKVVRATDGFYQTFKVSEHETEGNFLYNLGNRQWDIPVLRHQLENILPEQGFFKAFEVDHVFNVIGRKIMRLTARQFDTYTDETLTLLAIHDLTDKRKVEEGLAEAERLLAESKERLHFAIESAGIGSWDFNVLTKEFIWDNRCKELYGLYPKDLVDYSVFLDQVHPDDRKLTDDAVNMALKGVNHGEFNVEYRTVGMHDQKLRWIKSKGKAYFNEGKKATRFIGTVLDISMEKSLEQSTRELLLKKDEFISIASHELKTPVTSLKASLQLLNRMKNNPSPVMLPKLIDQSTRSMERITLLIDDLLNVTRMSEGQLMLNIAPFNMAAMLNQCCSYIREEGKHELIIQGDMQLEVDADEQRIEQVIINFLNNAIKYAPDSEKIYLIVERENGMAKVSVKDNGPGIPAEKIDYLFERYYRGDYMGKPYSGLGLGLYICSEIIKRHGGEIGVVSELGHGAAFWITLPVATPKLQLDEYVGVTEAIEVV
ncbi:chemotaxis protein CheB [Pedobacter antarcticus]|uniref:chemotaxis protein CheB n=1 Tax=Pedobacter antarcticus TaxID=34086 RepID=UPI002930FB57|nr:chemotaxis protein CheB [Pedobacter antarcticus]